MAQVSDSHEYTPGDILFDQYRVVEQLGSGGYGQVLAAEQLEAPGSDAAKRAVVRNVAIKVLRTDADAKDPAAVGRIRQEAQILEAIDHPSIVDIYDVHEDADGQLMVMELLEGDSIGHLLETDGPADPARVSPIAKQMLGALSAAHRKQVLHRDIKPDNIVVVAADDEPNGEQAKLLDFGIAKAHQFLDDDLDAGATLVNTRGGFVGTPRYCAPETAAGDSPGPGADLFSLGLVVSEWLTGTARIDASQQKEALAILVHPDPFDISDLPESWQPWLSRMIAKDPDQRYRSADEALAGFEALIEGTGEDIELGATEKQTPLGSHRPALAGELDDPPAAVTVGARHPPETSGESDKVSVTYFLVVAAISCAVVLAALMVVRWLLGN